jgi:eukaryotic-like serine/threonine-protein kinase
MNAETWLRAKEWLLEAAALPASERAAFLARCCPDDAVRRELLEMLAPDGTLSDIVHTQTLTRGTKLGPYEIDTVIGAGGMGEVYRARDSRLGRDVAIKVLPTLFATDRDRLARFEREAKLLASLNHPHICTLFDVGREGGIDYIVMECVEGELLSDRLRRGPLPIDKALAYAIEIADALDKAHAHGIVHRDLKPGNVMITKAGTKLLDFGLARSTRAPAHDVTKTGTILGTLRYMAPEQFKGSDADTRSDVWAFGCVLYQMLAGRPPFDSESEPAIGAAILEGVPAPLSSIARGVSPSLQRVVDRCLAKSPDDRWQSAADLRHELQWIARSGEREIDTTAGAKRSPRPSRERLAWSVAAAALVVAAAAAGIAVWRPRPASAPSATQLSIETSAAIEQAESFALSRDGRQLAYVGRLSQRDQSLIWVRSMDDREPRSLAGTAGIQQHPFWSPDGRALGFFADGKLKIINVGTGLIRELCAAPNARGGAWAPDGSILFAPGPQSGLYRAPAAGGPSVPVTQVQPLESHRLPSFLPDGVHYVFTVVAKDGVVSFRLGSLDSTVSTELFHGAGASSRLDLTQAYVVDGLLVFARGSSIMAQPLDEKRWKLSGDPMLVVPNVPLDDGGRVAFAVSESSLVYRPEFFPTATLTWLARNGTAGAVLWEPAQLLNVELSPDGGRAAVERREVSKTGLWVIDTTRNAPVRLADSSSSRTLWSRDGARVLFGQARELFHENIHSIRADGGGDDEIIVDLPDDQKYPLGWSPTGSLLYAALNKSTRWDLWESPQGGAASFPVAGADPNTDFRPAVIAPGGRLVANVVGGALYVQPVGGGTRVPVASGKVDHPRWRADARELFYVAAGHLMAADISSTDPVQVGTPRALFEFRGLLFSPSPDGQQFLAAVPQASSVSQTAVNVVINWTALLSK